MKTFGILLVVFDLGLSLRFNEQLGSNTDEVDSAEGRRRRRRRRRRSGGGGPPSGLGSEIAAGVTMFDMTSIPVTSTAHTETGGATVTIAYTGWMVCFVSANNADAVFHGEATFNFNEKKSYWFETRLAQVGAIVKADWFVGFAPSNYAAVGAEPADGVGFIQAVNSNIYFISKKNGDKVKVKVQTKLVNGVNLAMLPSVLGTQDSLIPSGPKTNTYKLGYAFIPLGQYGVSSTPTTAGAKGMFRVYLEGALVMHTEATVNPDDVVLALTIGAEGEHADHTYLMVDYVAYSSNSN